MAANAPQLADAVAVAAEGTNVLGLLGIDWKLFIAQLINFGIVTLVLWKWAYKPLMDMLAARKEKIEESLEKAARIDERMKHIGAEEGELMKQAHEKAQAILVTAETQAKEHFGAEAEKAKKHVENMIAAGKEELSAMKSHLITDTRKELAEVVVHAVEKIMGEAADKKLHASLVKRAQDHLGTDEV